MKNRSKCAAFGAGLLAFSICVGLASAERAFAQGVGNNKDVRVINTAAEPVPVTLTNAPVTPAAPQPISISGDVGVPDGSTSGALNLYTVPDGKMLIIEFVSFNCNSEDDSVRHKVTVSATDVDGFGRNFFFMPDGAFDSASEPAEVGSKQAQIFAGPGTPVSVSVRRTIPYPGPPGSLIFTNVSMTGHLVDIP